MALSKHVNPDHLLQTARDKHRGNHFTELTKSGSHAAVSHAYGARYGTSPIPKYHLASKGIDADAAYQLIHDELSLDGSPVLNLASFVHTWMPAQADKLMMENMSKNLIDSDEYESLTIIHARYFDVECRLVPISVESNYRLDPKKAMEYVDENTIGIFVILGSTYTGHYEPVKEMSDLLDEYEAKTGHSVPIHVDGVSGAFVAPFATPKLLWDFKIPRVVSINTSGHKFGLTYVGVGWVVWRDKQHLPKDLIFELHYLGSVEYSFSLNFSRPGAPIIAQYFNFVSLGFEGYRGIALDDMKNARLLSRALENSKYYTVLSDIHRFDPSRSLGASVKSAIDDEDIESYVPGLPVVAFRFSDDFQKQYPEIQQKWIQTLLRAKGWIVPNYELAPGLEKVKILRVVVRENMSEGLIERLVNDLMVITEELVKKDSPMHALDMLGSSQSTKHEKAHGKLDHGDGSKNSGTYAKAC